MRNAYRNIANDPLFRLGSAQRAYAAMNAGQIAARAQLTVTTAAHRLGLPVTIQVMADNETKVTVGSKPDEVTISPRKIALATLTIPHRVSAMMADPHGEGERLVAEHQVGHLVDRLKRAGKDASMLVARHLADEVLALDPSLRLRRRDEVSVKAPARLEGVRAEEREEARLLYEAEYGRIVGMVNEVVGSAFPPELRETLVDESVLEVWVDGRTLPEGSTLRIDRQALAEGSLYAYLRLQGALARMTFLVCQFMSRTEVDVDGLARLTMEQYGPRPQNLP